MRCFVVVNPRAHGGRTGRGRAALEQTLRNRGLDAELFETTAPGDATRAVGALSPGAFDTVICAGGDGTLFEVVNGLMARPLETRETLGVLPMGTGNAFARDLGLEPGDTDTAMEMILAGDSRPVDVAEVQGRAGRFHFINILGAGFVVRAGRAAQALKALGRGAYTLGALAALARLPALPMRIELDGVPLDVSDTLFVQVANSRFTGTRFLMAPEARIDDGLLDLVHVRRLPRPRILRLFPTIYDGLHVKEPEVTVRRARHVRLLAPDGLDCMADGEFHGVTPLDIQCLPSQIRCLALAPGHP